jgi:O-antigen ligase
MNKLAYLLLWITVFATPWQRTVLIDGVGTFARVAGLAAFAVGCVAIAESRGMRRPALFHVWAVGFVVWSGMTLFWTLDTDATVVRFGSYLQVAGLLWLIWELAPTHERRMLLFQAYVLGAYVSATAIILNYLEGQALLTRGGVVRPRFAPSGFNPNDVAFLMVLALPMAWHLGTLHGPLLLRWINRLYLLIAMLAILLTGSRSGLLLLPIALLIVPWTVSQLSLRTKVVMLIILAAAATVAWKYVAPAALARLATTRAELEQGTLNTRKVVWKAGLHLFPSHPLGGVGAGAFEEAVVPFLGYQKTGHNTYLTVLLEQGIVGLTLFLLALVSVFLHIPAAPPRERRFFTVLLLTLCLGLIPRTWQDEKQLWIVLALLLNPAAACQPVPKVLNRMPRVLQHADSSEAWLSDRD